MTKQPHNPNTIWVCDRCGHKYTPAQSLEDHPKCPECSAHVYHEAQKPTDDLRTIDDVIFEIEDYVGGNIEGQETVDRMGFTVFLRRQLEKLFATQTAQNSGLAKHIEPKQSKDTKPLTEAYLEEQFDALNEEVVRDWIKRHPQEAKSMGSAQPVTQTDLSKDSGLRTQGGKAKYKSTPINQDQLTDLQPSDNTSDTESANAPNLAQLKERVLQAITEQNFEYKNTANEIKHELRAAIEEVFKDIQ